MGDPRMCPVGAMLLLFSWQDGTHDPPQIASVSQLPAQTFGEEIAFDRVTHVSRGLGTPVHPAHRCAFFVPHPRRQWGRHAGDLGLATNG